MTKVERRGVIFSLICSLFFSVGFIIGSMYIKFNTNEMPKEIFIYLNPDEPLIKEKEKAKTVTEAEFAEEETSVPEPPVKEEQVQKAEEVKVASVPEPVKKEPAPAPKAAPKQAPAPKAASKPKTEPAKSQPKTEAKPQPKAAAVPKNEKAAPKEVVPEIRQEIMERAAEQNAKKQKKQISDADFDAMFADDEPAASTSQFAAANQVHKSSLQGNAGSNAEFKDEGISTAGQAKTQQQVNAAVEDALSNIKPRNFSTPVSDTTKSRATLDVSESNGKYSVKFSGGVTRELLRPKNPTLYVSEENASLVQITANVKITFTVLANGTVPVGNISFSPSALLPFKIQDELKEQIASWQFSAGSSSSTATFDYTLEVR